MELLREMLHQNIGLAIAAAVRSHSSQRCVGLNPIKNHNFGWGLFLTESPFCFGSDVQRSATENWMFG